jgi:glycosyltransferase involved in cell wall biosynthesis
MTLPPVLIVGNFASSWAGTMPVCEGLAARLQERGWTILTTSSEQLRIRRFSDMLRVTWGERARYAIAIVELYSGPAFIWAEAVCATLSALGKPYILWLHGGNLPEFTARWKFRVDRLFSRASAVVAQSDYLAGILPERRHIVRLVPNPLDLPLYHFRLRSPAQPNLIWLRSFHHIYNPSLAVEAVGRLKGEIPELRLTMIGPDKGDGSLERARERSKELDVENMIHFQPAVPKEEIPRWLAGADIFLNTSNIDNSPVSVQEAMACGLCVISTSVGGVPYLVRDRNEGVLVAPCDAGAIAEAVKLIIDHPDLAARISRGARSRVLPMDWSQVVESWERLLLSLPSSPQINRRWQP